MMDPVLDRVLAQARQPIPDGWLEFVLRTPAATQTIGWISPARIGALIHVWPTLDLQLQSIVWHAGDSVAARSDEIARAARALRALDEIGGWRDEAYSLFDDRHDEILRLERAAYRFFGLRSRAVHVNGFTHDGRLWAGRRAAHKATDPGQLDNLAAGGIAAGEAIEDCLRRELFEEAGVPDAQARSAHRIGAVHCRRVEPEGLHDECLEVFSLTVADGFAPQNQDREVDEFVCLTIEQTIERVARGEFTRDAAAAIAVALQARCGCESAT